MQEIINVSSTKRQEVIDITEEVKKVVKESGVKEGICVVYALHATAAVIINENWDPNICLDFLDALNELVPAGKWRHDKVDGNGDAHIKSALVGPSESLVIEKGELLLGQWQNLMLADFDGPKKRKIIVKIIKG